MGNPSQIISSTRKKIILCVVGTLTLCFFFIWRDNDEIPEFSRVDKDGLYWDYEALSEAYVQCQNSMRMKELFELMIQSRATHMVPQIIDSITTGGFRDTERKIQAIIDLTGHDFSKEFNITNIWGRPRTEETKSLLHQWWQKNTAEVLKTRGPKQRFSHPNHWPSLTLEIKSEKETYYKAEPIRLSALLHNNGDMYYRLKYKVGKPAFFIEYFKVLEDGQLTKLSMIDYPRHHIVCGSAITRWLENPRAITINAESSRVWPHWLTKNYGSTNFDTGKMAIRAILRPRVGKHKGSKLISKDLIINIVEPTGRNAQAYKYIMQKHLCRDLIYNAGSHWGSAHNDFLQYYGDAIYANYFRYNMGRSNEFQYPSAMGEKMLEIINSDPLDFPLLPECYLTLLRLYRNQNDLERMAELAQSFQLDDLKIFDPQTRDELYELIRYIDHN